MAIVHSAELACRSPPRLSRWRSWLPEEASTGLAPHSAAKLASLRTRPGLSPAVASSVAATWVATPCLARNSGGAARVRSSSSAASSRAISAASCWWRRARLAIAALAPSAGPARSRRRNRAATSTCRWQGSPARWPLFPLVPAWQACGVAASGSGAGRVLWSGQHPGCVIAGEAAVDEVAQVQGGGAVLEPGVVAGGAEVVEFEAPAAAGGDLGDDPLHVGPELLVVLT